MKRKTKEQRTKEAFGFDKSTKKELQEQIKKVDKLMRARIKGCYHSHLRAERMKTIIEDYSSKEWLSKLAETKGICPSCKKWVGVENLALDHIYPISKASDKYKVTGVKMVYTIDDVQPLCKRCNSKKGNSL